VRIRAATQGEYGKFTGSVRERRFDAFLLHKND
jgi:hypothetical protein